MAELDVKRGYRRLAIAVVGSWIVVWGAIGSFGAWQQSIWSRIFIEASRAGNTAELVYANKHGNEAANLIGTSLGWGLLAVPIALAFALGWWVYRGFRSADS